MWYYKLTKPHLDCKRIRTWREEDRDLDGPKKKNNAKNMLGNKTKYYITIQDRSPASLNLMQ